MLDFSEGGQIELTTDDLRIIEELERDERIIRAVQRILEKRQGK